MNYKSYDLKNITEIANGDEWFIRDMLLLFVNNVTEDIGKIQTLIPLEKWTSIAEVAHKMVPRFAYLSASQLQNLSSDIEKSVLIDNNLSEIAEKAEKLCKDSTMLVEQLKNDFDFLSN